MNKERVQLLILSLIILFGAVYGYLHFLLEPEWNDIQTKSVQLEDNEKYLEKLKISYEKFADLKIEAEELADKEEVLDKQIPEELDKPTLMMYFYHTAKQMGIQPNHLTFDSLAQRDGFVEIGISFSCTGTEANVFNFLDKLRIEQSHKFSLDSISMNDQTGTKSVNMRIIAYAYTGDETEPSKS